MPHYIIEHTSTIGALARELFPGQVVFPVNGSEPIRGGG